MNDWISVKDRLPESDTTVLISGDFTRYGRKFRGVNIGYRDRDVACWVFPDYPDIETVTHWMPMPDLPKEQEDKPWTKTSALQASPLPAQ